MVTDSSSESILSSDSPSSMVTTLAPLLNLLRTFEQHFSTPHIFSTSNAPLTRSEVPSQVDVSASLAPDHHSHRLLSEEINFLSRLKHFHSLLPSDVDVVPINWSWMSSPYTKSTSDWSIVGTLTKTSKHAWWLFNLTPTWLS